MSESPKEPWLEKGDTLFCFGDSLTFAQNGYVKMLEEYLRPAGIKVVNAGRGGDKTPWALTRWQTDVIDRHPSAVNIFLGTNDSVIGHGRWKHEPVVSPLTYKENLIWMIYLAGLYGKIGKFSITTPTDRVEGEAFDDFGSVRNPYCLGAREAAEIMNACLVPLDSVFSRDREIHLNEIDSKGLLYTYDGTHMNERGNRLIANTMLQAWGLKSQENSLFQHKKK